MSIISISKCLFIYFSLTYCKNLVDSTDSSATHNPGAGTQGGTEVTTKQAGGTDSNKKTGVDLSLKATSGTNEFDYKKSGNIVTYTANDDYCFNSVKNGNIVVWEAKDNKYADKVTLYGKGKKEKAVTINIPNGNNMGYVRNGKDKPWQEYDLSTNISVSLNVLKASDTFAYSYKKENNIETFTANPGFVFNEVISKYGTQKSQIWITTTETEFANKVVIESKKLTIHLKDNREKVYKSSGASWVEDTEASNQATDDKKKSGTDQSSGGTTGTAGSGA